MKLNKKLLAELFSIFSLPILILLIHIPLVFYHAYQLIWWIDIPMHFILGMFIGRSYLLFLKVLQRDGYLGKMHYLVNFAFVVSLVALTAVSWELMEFSLDAIDNGNKQISLANTMQDLFLGILGGAVGYAIQFFIRKKKNK